MPDTKTNKSRTIEILLSVGIVTGILLVLFPGIWTPLLNSGAPVPSENDSSPQHDSDTSTKVSSIPRPHWVDVPSRVASIKNTAPKFRTGLSTDGDFQPLKEIVTEELPELPILENQAPAPPQEEWEILELSPIEEAVPTIESSIDVPQIRPLEISDEIVGGLTPMLTQPSNEVFSTPRPFAGRAMPSVVPETAWWATQMQLPQLANRMPESISLDQVIWMALQQAPAVQVLNSEPEVQRTLIDQSIASFDWSTFVETVWTDTNEPVNSLLTTGRPGGRFLQQEFSVEGGLKKRLATGGNLRVAQSFGTLDNNSDFLDPADQDLSRLVIDYRQPLMRGAGQRFATTQIVLARLNFEQVASQSLGSLQEYIVEVVSAYWNLHQTRATLIQQRRSLQRAEELLASIGNLSSEESLRAEAAVSTRQTEVIRAEYEVLNSQDRLVNLTMGPKSERTQYVELIPEPLTTPLNFTAQPEALTYVALRNRPEVREAVSKIKSASALEYVATNELLPKLDAILSTYVSGLQGGSTGPSALENQFSAGDPSYSVGFGFELPVGNRAAKSKLQRQQLQTRIFGQQFQKTVGDVVLDVRIASRTAERLQREIQNNFHALNKAQQALEKISQRLRANANDQANSSLYIEDLLAAQSRLTLAEQRLLESQTEFAIALIDLKRATGELVNGQIRVDQFAPPQNSVETHAPNMIPAGQPTWNQPIESYPQGHAKRQGESPTLIQPPHHSFQPSGQLDSVEVTPEVIEWNSNQQ